MKNLLIIVFVALFAFACQNKNADDSQQKKQETKSEPLEKIINSEIRYLALGDSYTIGESVDPQFRWPEMLAKDLKKEGVNIISTEIIATTGWTTDELKKAIKKEELSGTYGLVSLLIGVNNQYRGYDTDVFEKDLKELIETAISLADDDPGKVFIVSIPDYGVTRFGSKRDPEKIGIEIDYYNKVKKNMAAEYGVAFYDITEISRQAAEQPDLVADDDLHPSAKQYRLWVNSFYPEVKNLINS